MGEGERVGGGLHLELHGGGGAGGGGGGRGHRGVQGGGQERPGSAGHLMKFCI